MGRITSNSLGAVSTREIPYGYIDLITDTGEHYHIKIDVHTFHETLDPGQDVEIEMERLGNTDIVVAKAISIVDHESSSKEAVQATT